MRRRLLKCVCLLPFKNSKLTKIASWPKVVMHSAINGRWIRILMLAQLGKWIQAIKFKGKTLPSVPVTVPRTMYLDKTEKGWKSHMFLLFLINFVLTIPWAFLKVSFSPCVEEENQWLVLGKGLNAATVGNTKGWCFGMLISMCQGFLKIINWEVVESF